MELVNQVENKPLRDEKGRLLPGNTANPNGRPKGQSLKEFAREYLMSLPPESKKVYLDALPREMVWKMAEGQPHMTQTTAMEGVVNLIVTQFNGDIIPTQLDAREAPITYLAE